MDVIESFYKRYRELKPEIVAASQTKAPWVNWHEAFQEDYTSEWLVKGLWPEGRHLHIHAGAKTGKSLLTLWMALHIATGVDPFSGIHYKPKVVLYLDREMTMQDVVERVTDMEYEPSQLDRLKYCLYPMLDPLDTYQGGQDLMELVTMAQAEVVIIDTLSRVVTGDENSNDTYRRFHQFTGQHLKAAGISMGRLDHEGHGGGHSRGASSKADDVDLIYQLRQIDGGLELAKKQARVTGTMDFIKLKELEAPLAWEAEGGRGWTVPAREKAKELDALGLPLDASKRAAMDALKQAGLPVGRSATLLEALHYRRNDPLKGFL